MAEDPDKDLQRNRQPAGQDDTELEIPAWVGAQAPRPRPAERAAVQPLRRPAAVAIAEPDEDPYDAFFDFDEKVAKEFARLPRRRGGATRGIAFGGLAVASVIVLLLAASGFWVYNQLNPSGAAGAAVTVGIPSGAVAKDLATLLHDGGVVSNETLFEQYLKVKGPSKYQTGSYAFARHMSFAEAVQALKKGPIPPSFVQVTLPEGLTIAEIRIRLKEAVPWFVPAPLDAALTGNTIRSKYQPGNVATLEGLLFPETYRFEEASTEPAAVSRMIKQFDTVASEVKLDSGAAKFGLSPYQVIIIASMIEREARVAEDRGKIARVIYNRIAAKMRLDIDATVVYAVGGRTSLTKADLEVDSPYNTRRYKGLPPTPIAAPGKASLEAALNPTEGPWLYYVLADRDGRHYFTADTDDFDRAVADSEAAGLLR